MGDVDDRDEQNLAELDLSIDLERIAGNLSKVIDLLRLVAIELAVLAAALVFILVHRLVVGT
jgi:hypothetical protein